MVNPAPHTKFRTLPFVPRRDDGRGKTADRSVANDHAQLDWPASSSSYPIRWRPTVAGADHGQKSEPAKEGRKGLTKNGPLQKERYPHQLHPCRTALDPTLRAGSPLLGALDASLCGVGGLGLCLSGRRHETNQALPDGLLYRAALAPSQFISRLAL
jgi:hypothetical protein